MPPVTLQVPSIILPTTGATELIMDVVEHTSLEFPVEYLQEKQIHIVAVETALVPAAIPGPLWCWVELSPYPSANSSYWDTPLPTSTAFWAAIGGGGGALPPVAPLIEISALAGAVGTLTHSLILPWAIHSAWARLVVQTPVAPALPAAFWVVTAMLSAKTP